MSKTPLSPSAILSRLEEIENYYKELVDVGQNMLLPAKDFFFLKSLARQAVEMRETLKDIQENGDCESSYDQCPYKALGALKSFNSAISSLQL